MKTICLVFVFGLFCSVTNAENVQIGATLDICANGTYHELTVMGNLHPIALQSTNYGQGLYPGKFCSTLFSNLLSDYDYFVVVDYIALAAYDTLTISNSNQNFTLKNHYSYSNPTQFFQISNSKQFTITLTAGSSVGGTGFRLYVWGSALAASLGNVNVSSDMLVTSAKTENAIVNLQTNGKFFFVYSNSSNIQVSNNGQCTAVCNKQTTTPVELTSGISANGAVFTFSQTNDQFVSIFRANSGTPSFISPNSIELNATSSITLDSPNSPDGLYPNMLIFQQSYSVSPPSTVSFELIYFETEDGFDSLEIVAGNRNERFSGALRSNDGGLYPGISADKLFFEANNTAAITIIFKTNEAVRGVGFKLRISVGNVPPASTTPRITTTAVTTTTTTPFTGQIVNISLASRFEGNLSNIASGQQQLWHIVPTDPQASVMFVLWSYGDVFSQNNGASMVVYTGYGITPKPWNVLGVYDYSTVGSTSTPLYGTPLSVKFSAGNLSPTGNNAIQFVAFSVNPGDLDPPIHNCSDHTYTIEATDDARKFSVCGYPKYVYPNVTEVFTFNLGNGVERLLFLLVDGRPTFQNSGVKLTVLSGTDVIAIYSSDSLNSTNNYCEGGAGKVLTVKYETTSGISSGNNLGAQFLVLPFLNKEPVTLTTPTAPTTVPTSTTTAQPAFFAARKLQYQPSVYEKLRKIFQAKR